MDQRGAAELNDYADLVADVEHRLHERMLWLTNILRERAAGIAQHQSDQINRLTLVSVIFLPITFVTGFFGMNFNWMIAAIGVQTRFPGAGRGAAGDHRRPDRRAVPPARAPARRAQRTKTPLISNIANSALIELFEAR